MIITRKKDPAVVMKALQKGAPVFIVGCVRVCYYV
jgi:hypothetical protein